MPRATLSLGSAWSIALGAALLIASSVAAFSAAFDRVHLGDDVLIQSRGGNPNNVLTQSSCSLASGFPACGTIAAACTVCTTSTYTNTLGGSNGGYYVGGGTTSCGTTMTGSCDPNLECNLLVPSGAACATPPPVMAQAL